MKRLYDENIFRQRLLMVLILFVVILPLCAQEYVYKGVEFNCKIIKDRKNRSQYVCITGFNVKAPEVTIPAYVLLGGNPYQVKTIKTFKNGVNYLAESLTLEEGIEEIENYSFNEFRNLKYVSLPSTIRRIGKNAFRNNDETVFELLCKVDKGKILRGLKVINDDPKPVSPLLITQPDNSISVPIGPVDVDIDIPMTSKQNFNTYCIILANENYQEVPQVDYAVRDGEIFKEYCIKTLGIPERQILMYTNATLANINKSLTLIESLSQVSKDDSRVIFYFAGHGMPSEKDRSAYLIPVDGDPRDMSTCYKLSDLYARLGNLHIKNVTVFLDACFSGMKRKSNQENNQALIAARGIAIKPKKDALNGNIIVFSATSDDETALSYQEKRHGMFTYFLLKKLKDTKGKVTYGELDNYLQREVGKNSILENKKQQSPSVIVSFNIKEKWRNLTF